MSAIPADATPFVRNGMAACWGGYALLSAKVLFDQVVDGKKPPSDLTDTRQRYPVWSLLSGLFHTLEWTFVGSPIFVPVAESVTLGMYVHSYLDITEERIKETTHADLLYLASLSSICMIAYSILKIGAYYTGYSASIVCLSIPCICSYAASILYGEFQKVHSEHLALLDPSAGSPRDHNFLSNSDNITHNCAGKKTLY